MKPFKRKYHQGRMLESHEQWLLVLIQRNPSKKIFAYTISRRDSDTIIPIIQACVAVGTTIFTDKWASYNVLGTLGYTHRSVNHSENFVDPVTGAHTQKVERMNRAIREVFHRNHVRYNKTMYPQYVAEAIWRYQFATVNVFEKFLEHLQDNFDPTVAQ